jgi:hypothetical protein
VADTDPGAFLCSLCTLRQYKHLAPVQQRRVRALCASGLTFAMAPENVLDWNSSQGFT